MRVMLASAGSLWLASAVLAQSTQPAEISAPAAEKFWPKDAVALRQEVDTFGSLEDGQPAGPGDWEMQLESGWQTLSRRTDPMLLRPALKYTPHRYGDFGAAFLENMQLRLIMPFELGNGRVEPNGDLQFGWQQRWVAEHDGIPSVSTLGEIRMPTGPNSNGADGTLTAIVAKNVGPGTVLLNAWARTAAGDNLPDLQPFQWGFRAGYKWQITERFATVATYVHQNAPERGEHNINLLELGAQWRTKHHLSFGPGVWVGLDGGRYTSNFGAGLRFIYLFNARDPPP